MKKLLVNVHPNLVFLTLLLAVSAYYGYHEIAFKRPQSTHHWRQADCASLALMYYQNGMKFFEPQTHNLTSDGGKTGFVAPSELPIMYYFVAILYKIFGYHDFIYRILNTLIFLTGIFYLFKLFRQLTKSAFWSLSAALLFFTSPVLAYYGNNFLTNSSSLAFSIIGWYFFLHYRETKVEKYFYYCMLFFCLGCCMKISSGNSLFALLGVYLLEKFKLVKLEKEKVFPKGIGPILAFLGAILLPFSWILYAHYYNQMHTTGYFSTGTFPLWSLDTSYINHIKDNVWNLWRPFYFSSSVLILLGLLLVAQLVFFYKNSRFFVLVLLIMVVEVAVYILLQFMTFADHDYYTIDLYIVLIFLVVASFTLWENTSFRFLDNTFFKWAFALFLLYNIYYTHGKMRVRYEGWMNEYPAYKDFHTIKPYLRYLGIAPLDTIVTIPEYSHFIHYLTNQRGWTKYADERSPRTTPELVMSDSFFMAQNISNGAKYLLVLDAEKTLEIMPAFKPYSKLLMGTYNRVSIYALKPEFLKQPVNELKTLNNLLFDAELMDKSGKFFPDSSRNMSAEGAETQSSVICFSGKKSVKLTPTNAFSMTTRFHKIKEGEEFLVSVLRYGKSGLLVASANRPEEFYIADPLVFKSSKTGWDSLTLKFSIPAKMNNQSLSVYLWNNSQDTVYFDNFRIVRKESYISDKTTYKNL